MLNVLYLLCSFSAWTYIFIELGVDTDLKFYEIPLDLKI